MHVYTIRKIVQLIFIICAVIFVACGKSDKPGEPEPAVDPVGLIPGKDFNASTPPTIQQFIKAYDTIAKLKPALLAKKDSLALAIFLWVKDHPNGRTASTSSRESIALFDLLWRLTRDEWKVLLLNPIDGYNASNTVKPSLDAAKNAFPCDADVSFEDSKADAVRHAYWNALMVKRTNSEFAEDFSTAHESGSTKPSATAMDLHNNKIGRDIAKKYPTATEQELLTIIARSNFFFLDDPSKAIPPEAAGSLVYFAAKRPYDGTLKGSFTNPDSGGPWDATFDFNQCTNTISGQLTIIRGAAKQLRRFTGELKADKSIALTISNPYVFENPEGLAYCANMKAVLTGTENALKGSWTASNCFLGGVIDIKR